MIERKEESALLLELGRLPLPRGYGWHAEQSIRSHSWVWVIKVLATTLGETGGDAVTMSMNLGYAIGSFIFIGIFAAAVVAQIYAKAFHPFLYWVTIVATTTLGTTMADFADRSLY